MKLAVSRANPGNASTSSTTRIADPVPTNRRARRYVDATPINPMTSPNAVNAHGFAPGQPQGRLHQYDLPESCGRAQGHVHAARAEQAFGGPHVYPVVESGNADRASRDRQPQGDADPGDPERHESNHVLATNASDHAADHTARGTRSRG